MTLLDVKREKCFKCYWFNPYVEFPCAVGWHKDFNCKDYFQPIDDWFFNWLTQTCQIPTDCFTKKGNFYEWNREEG